MRRSRPPPTASLLRALPEPLNTSLPTVEQLEEGMNAGLTDGGNDE
jgi:hypothetical protein